MPRIGRFCCCFGRTYEPPAYPASTMLFVDHKRGDPTPRAFLMRDRDEGGGRETEQGSFIGCDKYIRARIGEQRLYSGRETFHCCRVSELEEEADESIDILASAERTVIADISAQV